MFGRSSAAAADDIRAEIFGKMLDLGGKALRRFVVMLFAVLDFGQSGVRQNATREAANFRRDSGNCRSYVRAGAAVHPDNVDRERFERGQCGADLRPVEHRAERSRS